MKKQFIQYVPLLLFCFSVIACGLTFGEIKQAHQTTPAPPATITEVHNHQSDTGSATSAAKEQGESLALTPSPLPMVIIGSVSNNRTGTPVSAILELKGSPPANNVTIPTDDAGTFQLENPRFPLTVRVDVPGYEVWETGYNTLDALTGNPTYLVDIKLTPKLTEGSLVSAGTGEPLAGVVLTAITTGGTQTASTSDFGTFEFYGLLPNTLITVDAPDEYLLLETMYTGDNDLNLALQPRTITVTVRDGFTGSPVVNSAVSISQILKSTTNQQGEASITHIPREGHLSVSSPGYASALADYNEEEAIEVNLMPSSLQVVIRGSDTGQPLPQAGIYLGDTFFRADESGQVLLETLPLPVTPIQLMVKVAGYHRSYAQVSQTGISIGYEPPFSGAEGRWLTPAPCSQPPRHEDVPCIEFTLEPFQAKAIYVPLNYLRNRERMLEYLDFIAATELNAVIVDVKGDFGFIAWNSQVDLVSEVGAGDWFSDTWLPLDEFVAEAKARNIYTIARMVVFKDDPLAHGKPELAVVREDGTVWIDGEELGWANPFREEVWEYNIELAKEVAGFGFDELNFDYIRFPSDGDVGAIVYEEDNTLETRTAAISEFMTRLSESLKPYGVFTSADVFGLTIWVVPTSDMRIGQRIIDVAPRVDYLAPMVYPSTFGSGNLGYDNPANEPYNVVYRSQEEAETLVPPYVKVRPWLQGYWYSFEEMAQLKQAAIDSESAGWAWWNASGNYDVALFELVEE